MAGGWRLFIAFDGMEIFSEGRGYYPCELQKLMDFLKREMDLLESYKGEKFRKKNACKGGTSVMPSDVKVTPISEEKRTFTYLWNGEWSVTKTV